MIASELRRGGHSTLVGILADSGDLLARPDPPTALFTLNNRITAGALRALQRARLQSGSTPGTPTAGRPPRPAPGLIGFDDFELSDLLGVSVVGYDTEEMGRTAARLALDRLDGADIPAVTVVIGTELIERGSGERRP